MHDIDALLNTALVLFLVMDPLGNIPLFMAALEKVENKKRTWVIAREMIIALAVLLLFLFAGRDILGWLNLSQSAISLAGGVILFLISIRMIFPAEQGIFGALPESDPFIFPLAIPAIAGPSAIATVMLLSNQQSGPGWLWAGAIFIVTLVSTVILMFATFLMRFIGRRGLSALERLMGLLLTAISIEMLIAGIEKVAERIQ